MSKPRYVQPGTTYIIQRRTSERRFFLLPTKSTNEIFMYCLAYAANRHRMLIHEFVMMSNHYHLVATDTEGRLPAFMRDFGSLVARAVNATLGRWENFWSTEAYCAPALLDSESVIEKSAYVLANPVDAGLVDAPEKWEGPTSANLNYGDVVRIPCPADMFRTKPDKTGQGAEAKRRTTLPEEVTLSLVRPALSGRLARADIRSLIKAQVSERVKSIKNTFKQAKRSFMGAAKVLRQSWNASPRTHANRRCLRPTFASRDKWRRMARVQVREVFLRSHAEALEKLRQVTNQIQFPMGAYRVVAEGFVQA